LDAFFSLLKSMFVDKEYSVGKCQYGRRVSHDGMGGGTCCHTRKNGARGCEGQNEA